MLIVPKKKNECFPSCLRLVIDTNLVFSAVVFSSEKLSFLRRAWQNPLVEPLVSRVTAEEFLRVLTYPKFKLSLPDQRELVVDYLPYCTVVPLPESLPLETFTCRDPFDLPFLHLAAAGKAEVLLTGDSDLLSLNGTFVCSIVTADHFRGVIDTRA